jgi:hypothetical protein
MLSSGAKLQLDPEKEAWFNVSAPDGKVAVSDSDPAPALVHDNFVNPQVGRYLRRQNIVGWPLRGAEV